MNSPNLAQALESAELIHDRPVIEAAIARMGAQITQNLDGERALFLTVLHGGLIFAGSLALSIGCDLQFDYVHATRYRGATRGALTMSSCRSFRTTFSSGSLSRAIAGAP